MIGLLEEGRICLGRDDNNNHRQTFLSSTEQAIGMNLFRKSTLQFASGVMVDVVAFSL
jgi:hypothetical protein